MAELEIAGADALLPPALPAQSYVLLIDEINRANPQREPLSNDQLPHERAAVGGGRGAGNVDLPAGRSKFATELRNSG